MTTGAWIAVSDRLPDDDTLVLIAQDNEEVWTGYRDGDIWRYSDAMPVPAGCLTHWMPMPAPPARSGAVEGVVSLERREAA